MKAGMEQPDLLRQRDFAGVAAEHDNQFGEESVHDLLPFLHSRLLDRFDDRFGNQGALGGLGHAADQACRDSMALGQLNYPLPRGLDPVRWKERQWPHLRFVLRRTFAALHRKRLKYLRGGT